jgi:hypothetical protein
MQIIPLASVPNQSFTVTLDGNRWGFRIKAARDCMCADVSLNEQDVVLGQRIVAGTPVLPYRQLAIFGNFILLTDNDDLPDWEKFSTGQLLVYATPDEIAALGPPPYNWPDLAGWPSTVLDLNWRITTDFQQRITADGQFRIVSD